MPIIKRLQNLRRITHSPLPSIIQHQQILILRVSPTLLPHPSPTTKSNIYTSHLPRHNLHQILLQPLLLLRSPQLIEAHHIPHHVVIPFVLTLVLTRFLHPQLLEDAGEKDCVAFHSNYFAPRQTVLFLENGVLALGNDCLDGFGGSSHFLGVTVRVGYFSLLFWGGEDQLFFLLGNRDTGGCFEVRETVHRSYLLEMGLEEDKFKGLLYFVGQFQSELAAGGEFLWIVDLDSLVKLCLLLELFLSEPPQHLVLLLSLLLIYKHPHSPSIASLFLEPQNLLLSIQPININLYLQNIGLSLLFRSRQVNGTVPPLQELKLRDRHLNYLLGIHVLWVIAVLFNIQDALGSNVPVFGRFDDLA